MKKESSTNLQKYLGQKNLDSSSFEIPEISLAQLILEQFTVNKEQNSLKPKKQKTVTEIIHDQLGPGLDQDIFLDVIKDDSKNDEDSNRAK